MSTIYLAGGCFWGTQHFFSLVKGIESTQVGFANSTVAEPSYKQVCTGTTNAAETVKVDYVAAVIPLAEVLRLYFMTIDPTTVNRQGHDEGTQYRTGIYYVDDADKPIIAEAVAKLAEQYSQPLAIEVMPLQNFYPAEDYHQDYLYKNPGGYCHISRELMAYAANHK